MAYGVKDALAALARNTRFGDEGDRAALLEFLGRDDDPHNTDPFAGPAGEDEGNATADGEGTDKGSGDDTLFDPAEHTVDEVRDHLAAHPADRDRVRDAERQGKNRAGVLTI